MHFRVTGGCGIKNKKTWGLWWLRIGDPSIKRWMGNLRCKANSLTNPHQGIGETIWWNHAWARVHLPREEGTWSRHQHLFKANVGKTETCGLWTLSVKRSRVVFMHAEGISTPRVCHKGRQPLTECARHDLKNYVFSLFYVFLAFYGPFCIFYLFVVEKGVSLNCDEEIKPT